MNYTTEFTVSFTYKIRTHVPRLVWWPHTQFRCHVLLSRPVYGVQTHRRTHKQTSADRQLNIVEHMHVAFACFALRVRHTADPLTTQQQLSFVAVVAVVVFVLHVVTKYVGRSSDSFFLSFVCCSVLLFSSLLFFFFVLITFRCAALVAALTIWRFWCVNCVLNLWSFQFASELPTAWMLLSVFVVHVARK